MSGVWETKWQKVNTGYVEESVKKIYGKGNENLNEFPGKITTVY